MDLLLDVNPSGDILFDDTFIIIEGFDEPIAEEKDYLTEARGRYTEQFKNRVVFDKYIQLLLSENIELQKVFLDLLNKRTLDTATGAQLDVIGRIVGQPRDLVAATTIYYFGFQGAQGAQSFGTLTNPSVGGKWWSLLKPLRGARTLNDEEYLTLIKIKILKNITRASTDQLIQAARILYNVDIVEYTESPGVIEISIGRDFSDENLSIFKGLDEIALGRAYLPIPLGVDLKFNTEWRLNRVTSDNRIRSTEDGQFRIIEDDI